MSILSVLVGGVTTSFAASAATSLPVTAICGSSSKIPLLKRPDRFAYGSVGEGGNTKANFAAAPTRCPIRRSSLRPIQPVSRRARYYLARRKSRRLERLRSRVSVSPAFQKASTLRSEGEPLGRQVHDGRFSPPLVPSLHITCA